MHPQQGLFYKNDHIFSFDKYTAVFQEAFTAITKYQNQDSQADMVKQMIDGIQVQNNLTIKLDKTKIKDNKIGNWLSSLSYMETKDTEVFRVAKDNKNQGE